MDSARNLMLMGREWIVPTAVKDRFRSIVLERGVASGLTADAGADLANDHINSFEHAYASAWVFRDRNMLAMTPLGLAASIERFGILGAGAGSFGSWAMSPREFAVSVGDSLERMPFGVKDLIDSVKDRFNNEVGIRAQEYLLRVGRYSDDNLISLLADAALNSQVLSGKDAIALSEQYGPNFPPPSWTGPSESWRIANNAPQIAPLPEWRLPGTTLPAQPPEAPRCFLAGTPILLADGTERPIEQVRIGDRVMAFDPVAEGGRGALVPRPVTRTFQNVAQTILDLRGLRMTPGHVCLSGEGGFETIAEILRRDGTLVDRDGQRLRARTAAAAGSPEDAPVTVVYADLAEGGRERSVMVRAGIPCGALRQPDGTFIAVSLLAMMARHGTTLLPDGTLRGPDGEASDACDWPEGSTPFATAGQRNWILRTEDGARYVPDWTADLDEADTVAVNAGPQIIGSTFAGFRPTVVAGGGLPQSAATRHHAGQQATAALHPPKHG